MDTFFWNFAIGPNPTHVCHLCVISYRTELYRIKYRFVLMHFLVIMQTYFIFFYFSFTHLFSYKVARFLNRFDQHVRGIYALCCLFQWTAQLCLGRLGVFFPGRHQSTGYRHARKTHSASGVPDKLHRQRCRWKSKSDNERKSSYGRAMSVASHSARHRSKDRQTRSVFGRNIV